MARQQQDLVAKVIKQAHKLAEAGPITASPHKSIGSVLSVTDLKPSRRLTENLNLNHLTRSKSEKKSATMVDPRTRAELWKETEGMEEKNLRACTDGWCLTFLLRQQRRPRPRAAPAIAAGEAQEEQDEETEAAAAAGHPHRLAPLLSFSSSPAAVLSWSRRSGAPAARD